jgi:hypothetical protein
MTIALRPTRLTAGYLRYLQLVILIATAATGCNKQVSNSSENKGDPPKKSSGNGWESDVGSLPKWTAKDSLLAELDEEVVFGGYAMRPPILFESAGYGLNLVPQMSQISTFVWL